jgi:hypothetical protein
MSELEIIKRKIEKMDKKKHIEILKLIKNTHSSVITNENMNGCWINISFLPNHTIEELKKYIYYIEQQEMTLNDTENEKRELMKTYFESK